MWRRRRRAKTKYRVHRKNKGGWEKSWRGMQFFFKPHESPAAVHNVSVHFDTMRFEIGLAGARVVETLATDWKGDANNFSDKQTIAKRKRYYFISIWNLPWGHWNIFPIHVMNWFRFNKISLQDDWLWNLISFRIGFSFFLSFFLFALLLRSVFVHRVSGWISLLFINN